MIVFDRAAVRRNRNRAARASGSAGFLHREASARLVDRLQDTRRAFRNVLDIGGGAVPLHGYPGEGDGGWCVSADLADGRLRGGDRTVCLDEEFLPFGDGVFDLVVSRLTLHWVNDLPGALIQLRRCLRPDGLFVAAMLGGDTLVELRDALLWAESATAGGGRPRVSPMVAPPEAVALMQRAGFALPVVDVDTVTATYADLHALTAELRAMGEANAVAERGRGLLRRDTLAAAADRYRGRHAGPDGRIPATFQIVWLTGWAPDVSQPRPLAPGSAERRLADALGAEERGAGDQAAPGPEAVRPPRP